MIDYSKVNAHLCDNHVIGIFRAGTGDGHPVTWGDRVLSDDGTALAPGYYYASTDTFDTPALAEYRLNRVSDWHVVVGPYESFTAAVEALLTDLRTPPEV